MDCMQFLVEVVGLWRSTRSIIGLPGLVIPLAKFLRTALLLIPVITLSLHPPCNLLRDGHVSTAGPCPRNPILSVYCRQDCV